MAPARLGDDYRRPIGSAVFDGTDLQLRDVSFTPERVKRAQQTREK